MSLLVVNEDHYVKLVTHDLGDYVLHQERMGTRYVAVVIRTLVDPGDPADVAAVHAVQDRMETRQDEAGVLELPDWDQDSLDGCRNALLELGRYVPPGRGRFGDVDEVEPIRHLISTAGGLGRLSVAGGHVLRHTATRPTMSLRTFSP